MNRITRWFRSLDRHADQQSSPAAQRVAPCAKCAEEAARAERYGTMLSEALDLVEKWRRCASDYERELNRAGVYRVPVQE